MKKKFFAVSILAVMLSSSTAFAVLNPGDVTSPIIKVADGTSGQDTTKGAGVKTNHIQNGAVTDAKVATGISESKITNLQSDLASKSSVTHNHDSLYQQKYGKVAVVAVTGGDYTNPLTAMSNLATWCGTPSATNTCLLKIMPGVYDLGAGSLQMQNHVDIEGAGENVTKISGSNNGMATSAVVYGASNAEIRFLSMERNVAAGAYGQTFYASSASTKVTNVTIIDHGWRPVYVDGTATDPAIFTNVTLINDYADGIDIYSYMPTVLNNVRIKTTGARSTLCSGIMVSPPSNVVMNNVSIDASGSNAVGIYYQSLGLTGGVVDATNVKITSTGYGVYQAAGTTESLAIKNSSINGATYAIDATSGNTFIGNSQISGGGISGAGNVKCIGAYDGNYNAVTCP
jgi:hypothetical protein